MCIIIDSCAFGTVFNSDAQGHDKFKPVKKWICDGIGKIVYGGAKYNRELNRNKFLIELNNKRKTIKVDDKQVDKWADLLKKKIPRKDFDDPHIIAIVIVSGCRLFCSKDKRAFPYVKKRELYPNGIKPPKMYTSSSHQHLLCKQNIPRQYL